MHGPALLHDTYAWETRYAQVTYRNMFSSHPPAFPRKEDAWELEEPSQETQATQSIQRDRELGTIFQGKALAIQSSLLVHSQTEYYMGHVRFSLPHGRTRKCILKLPLCSIGLWSAVRGEERFLASIPHCFHQQKEPQGASLPLSLALHMI